MWGMLQRRHSAQNCPTKINLQNPTYTVYTHRPGPAPPRPAAWPTQPPLCRLARRGRPSAALPTRKVVALEQAALQQHVAAAQRHHLLRVHVRGAAAGGGGGGFCVCGAGGILRRSTASPAVKTGRCAVLFHPGHRLGSRSAPWCVALCVVGGRHDPERQRRSAPSSGAAWLHKPPHARLQAPVCAPSWHMGWVTGRGRRAGLLAGQLPCLGAAITGARSHLGAG